MDFGLPEKHLLELPQIAGATHSKARYSPQSGPLQTQESQKLKNNGVRSISQYLAIPIPAPFVQMGKLGPREG